MLHVVLEEVRDTEAEGICMCVLLLPLYSYGMSFLVAYIINVRGVHCSVRFIYTKERVLDGNLFVTEQCLDPLGFCYKQVSLYSCFHFS
jgi:hypothetical protein